MVSEIQAKCDMIINCGIQFCCEREIGLKPARLKIDWLLRSFSVPEAERVISEIIFLPYYTEISKENS
jgi:hypothetical protein